MTDFKKSNKNPCYSSLDRSKVQRICFVTHRPTGVEQHRFISSLSKVSDVEIIKPWFYSDHSVYFISLKRDTKTLLTFASLILQTLPTRDPIFLDSIDVLVFPCLTKKVILEFSTPLHIEMEWLGYKTLCKLARRMSKLIIKKSILVICANQVMRKYCIDLGAKQTCIVPNYPKKDFRATVNVETWRGIHGIPINSKVAIFVSGGRMREIYGLDLLLQSWKLVERCKENVMLIIIGPAPFEWLRNYVRKLGLDSIRPMGVQNHKNIPNWINASDVCLAPRTPGFPSDWYNDKDSTKISEYAALRKPIVAAGYLPSNQYLLVDRTPEALAEGILRAFDGKVKPAEPHFWEENEDRLLKAVKYVMTKK